MAPSTRLQRHPARRVHYDRPTALAGSRGNSIVLQESPLPEPTAERTASPVHARKARQTPTERVKAGAVVKSARAQSNKSDQATAKSKKKAPAARRECSICAITKSLSRSFKTTKDTGACAHFQSICTLCTQKLIKDKMARRQLGEPELVCPFPKCEHRLAPATLEKVCTNSALFAEYDKALVKHHLAASPNFIACLSPTCGLYFSIEACTSSTNRSVKQKISCCYCEYEMCLSCVRPWHGSRGCSKAKEKENLESLAQIKAMGAKSCPSCGVNIEKRGGCDHMSVKPRYEVGDLS
tara:strand:- start:3637 stop:4524 length:888 start_codon:yes stop_codon:yes gene_type:complete